MKTNLIADIANATGIEAGTINRAARLHDMTPTEFVAHCITEMARASEE